MTGLFDFKANEIKEQLFYVLTSTLRIIDSIFFAVLLRQGDR